MRNMGEGQVEKGNEPEADTRNGHHVTLRKW